MVAKICIVLPRSVEVRSIIRIWIEQGKRQAGFSVRECFEKARISGRMVVSGCDFMDAGKKAIVLEKGLEAATITGRLLRGEEAIVDESGGDVQTEMNSKH